MDQDKQDTSDTNYNAADDSSPPPPPPVFDDKQESRMVSSPTPSSPKLNIPSIQVSRATQGATVIDATNNLLDGLIIIFLASLYQMIFWAVTCSKTIFPPFITTCPGEFIYFLSVGCLSALIVGIYLLIFYLKRTAIPENTLMIIGGFLSVWWAAGILGSTFHIPLNGTGYFAAWIAFGFSGKILYNETGKLRQVASSVTGVYKDQKGVFVILVSSFVVLLAAIFDCASACTAFSGVAMGFGVISGVICAVLILKKDSLANGTDTKLVIGLGVLWSIGLGVLTIGGPFIGAGNGLYATWVAFVASFYLLQSIVVAMRSQNQGGAPAPSATNV